MPVQSCRNWVCDCPTGIPDLPVENLSAERPDVPFFLGWTWNGGRFPDEPWGEFWGYGCGQWCYSTESQVAANRCAARLEALCPKIPDGVTDGVGPDDIDPDGGDGNPTTVYTYYSAERSCQVVCLFGDVFTYTLPASSIISHVSQADADAQAEALCWKLARVRKVCWGGPLAPACTNQFYEHTFMVSGGVAPYRFQVDGSTLPNGFALDEATGYLSGNGTTPGPYNIVMAATDSNTPPTTIHKTFPFYLTEITSAVMDVGAVGTPYSDTLEATGASPSAVWSVISGSLPPGLVLDSATGVISGTPTVTGVYNFVVSLG